MTQQLSSHQARSLANLAATEAVNRIAGGLITEARMQQIAKLAANAALKQLGQAR
jgi:hypothetical protein